MIKSLSLSNFKSIGKTLILNDDGEPIEGRLEFKPLTVFCGKNSSGKSTVLQSILLLAQTLQSNVPTQTLVLNGPMVKLGSVDDVKTDFYSIKNIYINIDILTTELINGINEIDADYYRTRSNISKDEQLGYFEKTFFLEEMHHLFMYSFSNSFSGIKEAIFDRTGFNFSLNKVKWKSNPLLSITIKDFMIKNNVNYSMTTWHEGGISNLIVNKRKGNKWFYVGFAGINGKFLSQSGMEALTIDHSDLSPADMHNFANSIKRLDSIFISFDKKSLNDISHEIPAITEIKLQSTYIIDNGIWISTFRALRNNKPQRAIAKRNDFDYYTFDDDKYIKNLIKDNLIENRRIGIKLNHFLPEKIIYTTSQARLSAKEFIDEKIKAFSEANHVFSRQSIEVFTKSIHALFKFINDYEDNNNKEITIFDLPDDIPVKDGKTFKNYVDKVVFQLEELDILFLLAKAYSFHYNKYNIENKLNPDLDDNYIFPDLLLYGELGCTIEDRVKNINSYFQNNIQYIGPLREEPHLQYDPYIESSINIGIKGENCAGVLFNSKNKVLKYINPDFFIKNCKIEIRNYYFSDVVNEWLRYIEVANSVDVTFNGRYGYELKINSLGKNTRNDLTNVGVGVSQVLPIILVCLLSPEESTIIIEQPELHLHPSMQLKLTDFFIATMLCNKQLIIETHSEYIINRLRLRAINCPTENPIKDSLNIYFTENLNNNYKTFKKGNTIFRQLEINEYAAMSDWPDGFFDESSKNADEIISEISKKWNENTGGEND